MLLYILQFVTFVTVRDAASRLNADPARRNVGAGILGLGGLNGGALAPLTPGVYTFGSISINADIFLQGGAADVFIIQATGNIIIATNVRVTLTGGVLPQNVFWQNAGYVQAEAGSHMEGKNPCSHSLSMLFSPLA